MRIWRIIKTILYIIAGLFIIIFNKFCLDNLPYVVGTVILAYGLENVIVWSIKGVVKEDSSFFEGLVLILLSLIMMLYVEDNFVICLVIWAVWNLIREGREISISVKRLIKRQPGLFNILESIIIIVLSTELILEPVAHHAHVHIFLLGVELLLEVLFQIYNILIIKLINKIKEKKENK